MYQAFYKLTGKPFQLTPDPNFFFASEVHARALAYLRYGLHQAQGFVVVTGDPGTGKSMLVQTVLRDLPKQQVMVGTLTNTFLDPDDILRAVVNAFGLQFSQSSKAELIIRFQTFLTQQSRMGKQVLLMVDEAQNLPRAALEELRMLSNFQDGNKMLLQTFLIGQQQLRHTLADPELMQLSQRIIAGCHLRPLNAEETRKYVECRLKAVTWRGDPSLTGEALALIHQGSKGFPRMTNVLCDRLLLAAFLEEKHEITGDLVRSVLEELGSENSGAWVDASKSIESVGHGELAALPEFIGPDFVAAGEGEESLAALDTLLSRASTTASSSAAGSEELSPLLSTQRDPVLLTTISPFALQQNSGGLSANDAAPPLQSSTATAPPRVKGRFPWFVVALLLLTGGVGYSYYAGWWSFETLDHLTSQGVVPSTTHNDLSSVINNSTPAAANVSEVLENGVAVDVPKSAVTPPQEASVGVLASPPAVPATPPPAVKPVTTQTEVAPLKKTDPKSNSAQVKPLQGRNEGKPETGGAIQNIKREEPKPTAAPTLSGATKNRALQPTLSPPISTVAKTALLQDFVASYEKGDIGGFVQLFDQNAVSDKGETLKEISGDYRDLFEATDMRRMSLNNFKWEKSPTGELRGKGEFEVNVWLHDRDDPVTSSGMIEFDVVNENGRLAIKKLSHYPQ